MRAYDVTLTVALAETGFLLCRYLLQRVDFARNYSLLSKNGNSSELHRSGVGAN
jgi:hypothetical protein